MKRNIYVVVAEQRRDDWIAEFFLEQVERCLNTDQRQGLPPEQARERLVRVATYIEGQGWPVRWVGSTDDEELGLTLNNGGVAVLMRKERRREREPAFCET